MLHPQCLISYYYVFCLVMLFPLSAWAWTPPIGIPTPTWPLDLDLPRPSVPNPWTSDQTGFYYIDPSGCSDARTYGHPGASRCSLPSAPAAGSVIAMNGTLGSDQSLGFSGTSTSPIWLLGYDPSQKPIISGGWEILGSYLILDSLAFDRNNCDGNAGLGGDHQMVRDCSFRDPCGSGYGCGVATYGSQIVFYRNMVYDQGNWQTATDVDRHGIKVAEGTSDLWIVDSTFYHCQGDGVQVGDQNYTPAQVNRIYLGRNIAYENMQSCLWTKNATDVIFSQNTCYNISYSNGGIGQGLGGQYDPQHVWYLHNTIHNTKAGIMIASSSNGGGGPWYVIGNVIHDVESEQGGCNPYDMGGVSWRNEGGLTVLYNTFYDVDLLLGLPSGSGITVRNNIFAAKKGTACEAIVANVNFTSDYNLYSQSSYDIQNEAHRVIGDPLFVNAGSANFALQGTSPATGAANPTEETAFAAFQSRYGLDIRRDKAGLPRPQGGTWDIGAYEVSSGIDEIHPAAPTNLHIL